jgi:hypothetical protein
VSVLGWELGPYAWRVVDVRCVYVWVCARV